jgi:2-methylisocitrate lyase-like PEP mutase family enzyme
VSDARQQKAQAFRALHVPGNPLILFNVWDAGSALAVAAAGAKAVATGSASVAAAHNYPDGEAMPLDLVLANAARIAGAVPLPASIDLVRGYGERPAEIAATMRLLWEAGAVGCNIEDSLADGSGVSPAVEQGVRIRSAKQAEPSIFVNARVDLFLHTPPAQHDELLLDQALGRAALYAGAGADGIFVPGLQDEALIGRFCSQCARPVNVFAMPGSPSARLASLGVARISHGSGPYRAAMAKLEESARAALG